MLKYIYIFDNGSIYQKARRRRWAQQVLEWGKGWGGSQDSGLDQVEGSLRAQRGQTLLLQSLNGQNLQRCHPYACADSADCKL